MDRTTPTLHQHLLTRSDFARMGVPAAQILAWLAANAIEQVGAVTHGDGEDPVFTVAPSLRAEIAAKLAVNGKPTVVLSPLRVRSFLLRTMLGSTQGHDAQTPAAPIADAGLAAMLEHAARHVAADVEAVLQMAAEEAQAEALDPIEPDALPLPPSNQEEGECLADHETEDDAAACFDADDLAAELDCLLGDDPVATPAPEVESTESPTPGDADAEGATDDDAMPSSPSAVAELADANDNDTSADVVPAATSMLSVLDDILGEPEPAPREVPAEAAELPPTAPVKAETLDSSDDALRSAAPGVEATPTDSDVVVDVAAMQLDEDPRAAVEAATPAEAKHCEANAVIEAIADLGGFEPDAGEFTDRTTTSADTQHDAVSCTEDALDASAATSHEPTPAVASATAHEGNAEAATSSQAIAGVGAVATAPAMAVEAADAVATATIGEEPLQPTATAHAEHATEAGAVEATVTIATPIVASPANPESAPTMSPATAATAEAVLQAALTTTQDAMARVESFLDQLKGALVEMAQRPATPVAMETAPTPVAPQPMDVAPLVAALQAGFERSSQQAATTSAALTTLAERIGSFGEHVEHGVQQAVAELHRQPTAERTATEIIVARSDRTPIALFAIAAMVLAWSALFWLKTGSSRLALGTLIGANVVGCCLLAAWRRRI